MKIIAAALLFLLGPINANRFNYISIEHIGMSDKPIASIFISKEIRKDSTYNYVVSVENYIELRNVILLNKSLQHKDYEYGSFKVVIHETKTLTYYFTRSRSIQLFDCLIKAQKKENINKDLLEKLKSTKIRIDF